MDSAAVAWLNEMELDNSMFPDQCDFIDSFDEEEVAVIQQDLENCLSDGNNSLQPSSSTPINNTPPELFHKPNKSSSKTRPNPDRRSTPRDPIILSFGNPHSSPEPAKKMGRPRLLSPMYDHIITERRRRELLSQRFLLLTAIVPGLKKKDKISVLGDTIKYMKQLQERKRILEEQVMKQIVEPAVLVKKSQLRAEDNDDDDGGSATVHPLPEIEARICNNNLLIRVHCEKQKGVLVNLLSNVEKFKLIVVQTNVVNFGNLALDINITAEMEKEFKLTVKEIVIRLRAALQSPRGGN